MTNVIEEVTQLFTMLGDPAIAEHSMRFFKTGRGEYGEGDKFLGIRVPVIRKEVKKHLQISLKDAEQLLQSKYHEIRLFAVILLTEKFNRANENEQQEIYSLYLANTAKVNNWDIVDASAHKIVGPFLLNKDRSKLYELARSKSMWERRIAIISTFYYIRHHQFEDTLKISKILLADSEDLIHKAVGWMLREVGKKSPSGLKAFLTKHSAEMPRTMLRYAIEKLPQNERKKYLRREK